MAAIGKFNYPDVGIDECADLVKVISQFNGQTSRDALALKLGHSGNSGRLSSKLSALRQFGLIEGHGAIKLTDLGLSLAQASNPSERMAWKFQAILKVPLLALLYDRFNTTGVESAALTDSMQTITGLGRSEVERAIPSLNRHLDLVTSWSQQKSSATLGWKSTDLDSRSNFRQVYDALDPSPNLSEWFPQNRETAAGSVESSSPGTEPFPTKDINPASIKIWVNGANLYVPFTREGVSMAQAFLNSLFPPE
ncbi:MAG: hypothetical protein CL793_02795 [Chloroflexi bacterium]|nr:hypothetical protein [Chloroflexota bacterium]|tara:strand:- start:4202 stop:4957 length:756 start_codon:yes stop_codon:yes gene_type:complete